MKRYFLTLIIISVFILSSCSSNHIVGIWDVSNVESSGGIAGNIGLVKLLELEGPISFSFKKENQLEILNKNGLVLETHDYRVRQDDTIEIDYLNDKQVGKLTFDSKNKVHISFPTYSYVLSKR